MQIKQNYQDQMNAWEMCVNALNIINRCYIENNHWEDNETIEHYYALMARFNRWHDEIKEMPY